MDSRVGWKTQGFTKNQSQQIDYFSEIQGQMPPGILFQCLRYVVSAADKGSFRQAAIELGVWESTVSRGIRDLEDEIGVALFTRSTGGVKLTNAGLKFLSHIRIAISRIDYALKDAGAAGRGEIGLIRIGVISSLSAPFVVKILRSYQIENPLVRVDFIENGFSEHVSSIRRNKIDVAFLAGNFIANNCEAEPLWEERLFIVLPLEHRLATHDEVTWNEPRNENFIVSHAYPGPALHDYIIKNISEVGYHPSVERFNVGRDSLISLVRLGRGLTLVNEASTSITTAGVIYRPISGELLPFNAVWSARNDNPAFRRFLSMAKSLAKKHPRSNSQKTNRSN